VSDADTPKPHPQSPSPICPHCGAVLHPVGKVVNVGSHKKWVDEWHCPTHGPVQPAAEPNR